MNVLKQPANPFDGTKKLVIFSNMSAWCIKSSKEKIIRSERMLAIKLSENWSTTMDFNLF